MRNRVTSIVLTSALGLGGVATGLGDGRSLADVAGEEGVDRAELVRQLVEAETAHLDEHVAAGDLTRAEADARRAELTERVAALVEREGLPGRGHRAGPDGDRDTGADTDARTS